MVLIYLIISLPIIFAQELNLQYDSVGNLVTGDSFYREYDGFNHLIRMRQGNTSSGNITEEFIWHPIEERAFIKKIYWNNQSLKTAIKYLNKNTIKIKNESGTFYENYIYQDDILVAQRDANGNKHAIHNDHLGSVSLITDSTGAVVENEFFSPYGEQIQAVKASRFSFTGKEFDTVNNEYDFMSRRSKPDWANRLTTPDRIFYDFTKYERERQIAIYDPQLLNPYAYARDNPYKYKDEEGNFIELITKILETINRYMAVELAREERNKQVEETEYKRLYEEYRMENPNVPFSPYEKVLVSAGGGRTEIEDVRRVDIQQLKDWKAQKLERQFQTEKSTLSYKDAIMRIYPTSVTYSRSLIESKTQQKQNQIGSSGGSCKYCRSWVDLRKEAEKGKEKGERADTIIKRWRGN